MSKIYAFLFCILFLSPVFAQFQHRQNRITNKKSIKPAKPLKRFSHAMFSPTGGDNIGQLDSLISPGNFKNSYTYGQNRKVSESLDLPFSSNPDEFIYKTVYAYNAQNLETETIFSSRTLNVTEFTLENRTTLSYQSNKLSEEIEYSRLSNNWEEDYKTTYTYDGQGKLTRANGYTKNGNVWEENEKSEYTYEANRLTKQEDFYFEAGSYEKFYEIRYIYNGAGKVSEEQWYNHNPVETLPDPHYQYRDVFEYDVAGNKTSLSHYASNSSAAPSPEYRDNMVFDTRYNISTVAVPFNDSYIVENFFTHGIVTFVQEFEWDETISNWANEESGRTRFAYSGLQVSNKPGISSKPVKVFPSPAQNQIFIEGNLLGDFQIFNINGKEMNAGKLTAQTAIKVEALPKGVYVLKVNAGNVAYTSRFMKD